MVLQLPAITLNVSSVASLRSRRLPCEQLAPTLTNLVRFPPRHCCPGAAVLDASGVWFRDARRAASGPVLGSRLAEGEHRLSAKSLPALRAELPVIEGAEYVDDDEAVCQLPRILGGDVPAERPSWDPQRQVLRSVPRPGQQTRGHRGQEAGTGVELQDAEPGPTLGNLCPLP